MDERDPSHSPTLPASAHDTAAPDPEGTQPSAVRRGPTLVGGRYALGDQLGAGGMGVVWEADDRVLPRKVAVKILHATADDSDAAMRLRREAELLAEVEHPNVVAVLDVGVVAPDRPFVVMERLRGRSLSAWLADEGPLGWPQAIQLAIQICDGLARAHALGIIHRDLKSSNVFVVHDAHGRATAKIIDFGLAKATAVSDHARVPTKSGIVFGTPAYMPPEQVRGETLDARADVYALGVMIFEMVAGRRPWAYATIVETLYAQLFEAPPPLRLHAPDVPPELEQIVQRCLAKQREGRPPDVYTLRSELLGVGKRGGTALPVVLTPVSQPVVIDDMRPLARRSIAPWIGVGALAVAIGAVAWWWQRPGPSPAQIDAPASSPVVEAPPVPVAAPLPAELEDPAPPTVIVMPQPLPAPIIVADPDPPPREAASRPKTKPVPKPERVAPEPLAPAPEPKPKPPALGKSGTFEDPFGE